MKPRQAMPGASLARRAIDKTAKALDVVILLLSLTFLLNFFWTDWAYRLGRKDLLERILGWLFAALAARAACALPWEACLRGRSLARLGRMILLWALAVLALRPAFVGGLSRAARQFIFTRVAFAGMDDEGILDRLNRSGRDYPRQAFIRQAREAIGEDESAAYVGDLRAHVIAAQLYPRKIYQLPELQKILLQMGQVPFASYRDSGLGEKAAPRLHGLDDPATRRAFDRMLAEKGIHWLLVYDAQDPRRCSIRRLR